MVECNSIDYDKELSLNNQHIRLNKINEVKDYFVADLKERELMSKRLSKYIAFCGYYDKSLIVLSTTSGSISIVSFATVIGTPVGIVNVSLAFSLPTGIVKKLLKKLEIKTKTTIKLLCWLGVN